MNPNPNQPATKPPPLAKVAAANPPLALASSQVLGQQLTQAEAVQRHAIAEAERLERLQALLSSQADHD